MEKTQAIWSKNIKNSKHPYDAWTKNAFVTDINDKDFYVNIRIRINKKSQ